jgi:hypothetical protein
MRNVPLFVPLFVPLVNIAALGFTSARISQIISLIKYFFRAQYRTGLYCAVVRRPRASRQVPLTFSYLKGAN